jgi:hypothetical protein
VPPLIHVSKVPSALTLPAGGGMVTYKEIITNPGLVALSKVKITDDKCAPMKYITGDTNRDSMLDTSESWTYTCRSFVNKTTTNTATASGEANDPVKTDFTKDTMNSAAVNDGVSSLSTTDFAIATVVVATAVPSLPNTGVTPAENIFIWSVAAVGIFATLTLLYFICKKQIV